MVNKADVGRFDGEIKTIAFNDGDTIQSLLKKAGLNLGTGEGVNNDSGDSVTLSSPAEDGETYYVVGNYKQGALDNEVKEFDKVILEGAIKDVDKERAEIQREKAVEVLKEVLGRRDVCLFNINTLEEELKGIEGELKVFYGKEVESKAITKKK